MKRQIRKLNLLIRFGIIDPDDFYVITVYDYCINLQGKYNSDILSRMNKWEFSIDDVTKYIKAKRKGITITLTE